MFNVFHKNRRTIGQLMVVLIFVSGGFFMFTFDGFVSESQATSCCGSETAVPTFAADSSGDFGSDMLVDTLATSDCGGDSDISTVNNAQCTCLGTNCGSCNGADKCSGNNKPGCPDNSSCNGSDSCSCDGRICGRKSKCSGSC